MPDIRDATDAEGRRMLTMMSLCRHHLGDEGVAHRQGWLLVTDAAELGRRNRRFSALAGMQSDDWHLRLWHVGRCLQL